MSEQIYFTLPNKIDITNSNNYGFIPEYIMKVDKVMSLVRNSTKMQIRDAIVYHSF